MLSWISKTYTQLQIKNVGYKQKITELIVWQMALLTVYVFRKEDWNALKQELRID